MQPRLKENAAEWRKFAVVLSVLLGLLTWLAWRRGWVTATAWIPAGVVMVLLPVLGLIKPRWLRPVYRGGMTATFHIGQVVGQVWLVLLFIVVITPLGAGLRLFGKDLLGLRRRPGAQTYWAPPKPSGRLDQMF